MNKSQFGRVLLQSRFELDRFDTALSRLEAHQFPSDVAKSLIAVQKAESELADQSLLAIENDYEDDPKGTPGRLVSEYRKLLSRRRYLGVIENSRSDEVPWSLIPSIEKLAKAILPDKKVVVTTTQDMNYMVSWSRTPDQPIVTIYLPKLHRANAFLHLLIAHELFHPSIEPFIAPERDFVRKKLRDYCASMLGKLPLDLFSMNRLDSMLTFATDAWEKAVSEMMCDMGAVSVFGPAALWTLSSFAASNDLDVQPAFDNQFYPSWRRRIRAVMDYLFKISNAGVCLDQIYESLAKQKMQGHIEAIKECLAEDRDVCSDKEMGSHLLSDELMKQVYNFVDATITRAFPFIQEFSSKFEDRWDVTFKEVPALLLRLKLLVPPSEIIKTGEQNSTPSSMTAIALACWIERLYMERNGGLDLNTYRRLCRLMLKATEDAELKSRFIEWSSS